jgi:hypothetical protein
VWQRCQRKVTSFSRVYNYSQYEKGRLKDQRTLPKDLRGKPSFRPAYVRCLHGLDNVDRIELLNKVYINSILGHSRTQCPFTLGATRALAKSIFRTGI